MRRHLEIINSCWTLPKNKVLPTLKKFAMDFNKTWYGNNKEFLYLKVFERVREKLFYKKVFPFILLYFLESALTVCIAQPEERR